MRNPMSCVILAGGVGHRFANHLSGFLQPICGVPVIGHVVRAAESLGIDHVTVVSNVMELEDYLGMRTAFIYQSETTGSGHALYRAKANIEAANGDLLVVYGDRPMLKSSTLEHLIKQGKAADADCAMLTVFNNRPHGHARIIRDNEGKVLQTGRDCEISTATQQIREVVAGAYYFRKETLLEAFKELKPAEQPQFFVTDIITWMASNKKVITVLLNDVQESQGVYSFKELAGAEEVLQATIQERCMEAGVRIVDPRTTWIGAEAQIGRDTVIFPNTVIEGPCEVGRGCKIGPFARIRPGTVLHPGARVENFMEAINSLEGTWTKPLASSPQTAAQPAVPAPAKSSNGVNGKVTAV